MKRLAIAVATLSVLAVAVLLATREKDERAEARPSVRADHTRTCNGDQSVRPFRTTRHDAVLTRGVKIHNFRRAFAKAKPEDVYSPRPGLEVLKAPVVFAGSRDIMIAVAPSHRAVLGLDFAAERRGVDTVAEAHSSVRFRACPGSRGETGYPGGLLYEGPWPACVPVHVSVGGRHPVRHLLSLGAGSCG